MRPATYESEAEAKVLKRWFSGRNNDLENTTFVLLDPTGEQALSRAGRGPEMVYSNAASFSKNLAELAQKFDAKKGAPGLAQVPNFRLALNVAASDGLPLVVIAEDQTKEREKLVKLLAKAQSNSTIAGQAHYVVIDEHEAIAKLAGYVASAKVFVLQPDQFGQTATIVATVSESAPNFTETLATALQLGQIQKFDNHREHVRKGRRAGISWKSTIPVSDSRARHKAKD